MYLQLVEMKRSQYTSMLMASCNGQLVMLMVASMELVGTQHKLDIFGPNLVNFTNICFLALKHAALLKFLHDQTLIFLECLF